jgi:predicted ester cyclase
MIVEVTQYMRPVGRQVLHELEIDNKCADKYKEILSCGCRLACEQLQTLEASQTIEHRQLGFDFDMVLTKGNDFDDTKLALEAMILRFDKVACEAMKRDFA